MPIRCKRGGLGRGLKTNTQSPSLTFAFRSLEPGPTPLAGREGGPLELVIPEHALCQYRTSRR
eukprot:3480531-Rhodomonas_salina.1